MPRSNRFGMGLHVYEHLLAVSVGYDQVSRALAALGERPGFKRREIARFSAMAEEARAATTSYLTEVIEIAETEQAGRMYRRRRARERDEQGSEPP